MVTGFQTSTYLHEFDETGRVRRYPLTAGFGQQPKPGSWGHAIFVPRTHPGDICGPLEDITLMGSGPDRQFERLPFSLAGEAVPRPETYVHFAIMRTHNETGETKFITALRDPLIGALPVFMGYSEDDEAVTARAGLPIMRILKTREEFDHVLDVIANRTERREAPRADNLRTLVGPSAQREGRMLRYGTY